MAEITPDEAWIKEAFRGLVEEANKEDTWSARIKKFLADIGAAEATRVANEKEAVEFTLGKITRPDNVLRDKIAQLIVYEFRIITGIALPLEVIQRVTRGEHDANDGALLGGPLLGYLLSEIREGQITAGMFARTSGEGEAVSTAALMGASLRLQVGAQYIRHIASVLPSQFKTGVNEIADMVDKAINLDDAIEDMLQAALQPWLDKGLEQYINRKLKPADLSATEAFHAVIAGKLTEGDLGKILDNAGYRDDIRQILRDFAASNLTESDLQDSYNRGLLTRTQVKEQYKNKFFEDPDAELKTKLVEGDRRKKLEEKVYELWGNLYRDGVATKQEVTPYLESYGLKPDEQELWFQVQELERRQRKWLSNAQIEDMLEAGLMDVGFAIDYQVLQGMTGEDATNLYMEYILKKFKKDLDDDCQKILKEAFTPAKLLSGLLAKLPTFNLGGLFGKVELEKILQCLLTNTTKVP